MKNRLIGSDAPAGALPFHDVPLEFVRRDGTNTW